MAPKKSKVKKPKVERSVTQPAKGIIERSICSHPMLKRVQKEYVVSGSWGAFGEWDLGRKKLWNQRYFGSMDGRLRYFKRGKFTKWILVICALFVPYLLRLLSCKSVRVTTLDDMSSEFDMINQIYSDAVKRSQEAFKLNGGIKDGSMISLGHGPKIRLWDYFGPNFNCVSKERVGKIGDGGKWLCGVRTVLPQKNPCVVYSIGSKGEVSFEVGVQEKLPHCEIHIFDPTLTVGQKEVVNNREQNGMYLRSYSKKCTLFLLHKYNLSYIFLVMLNLSYIFLRILQREVLEYFLWNQIIMGVLPKMPEQWLNIVSSKLTRMEK
ncbi:unnamed protein product [Bathycoccus prasinos]